MPTLDDLKRRVRHLSDEELMALLEEVRTNRRAKPERKAKTKTEKKPSATQVEKAEATLAEMSEEAILKRLKELQGDAETSTNAD